MQAAAPGRDLAADEAPRRGDLIFWRGHVGVMVDETRFLHANAFHMAVALEPLAATLARLDAAGEGRPTAYRRLDLAHRGG
jgi:cell wall-associated NlpC family hydrolase